MSVPPGRRERKKLLTRQAISDVATALFMERGFDAVTVAEIAAVADVAVQTVFNHFPAKEDLFFDETGWVTGPADALRSADPGVPVGDVLEAYYRGMLDGLRAAGHLSDAATFAATIEASETLRARRARLADEMRERIAAVGDGPCDWRRRLFAARYAAIQQVLDDELFRLLQAHPEQHPTVLERLSPTITEAFAALRG